MHELKEVVVNFRHLFLSKSFFFLLYLLLNCISELFKVLVLELNQNLLRLLRFFYQGFDKARGILHFLDHGHHTMSAAYVILAEFVDDSDAFSG